MKMDDVFGSADKILSDRRTQYGKAERSFDTISRMWTAYLIGRGVLKEGRIVTPRDSALLLSLLKLARCASDYALDDSIVDAVNYLRFAAELDGENGDVLGEIAENPA